MIESLALLLLQSIVPLPSTTEVGRSIRVEVRDAEGALAAGVAVTVVEPDGSRGALGVTAADGAIRFAPSRVGRHRLRADVGGVRLVAPVRAVAAPPRAWLGVAGAIVGMAFLVLHLRWFRSDRQESRHPP